MVVAVDAGYVHWAALTKRGQVFTCSTGSDGYAGKLSETMKTGGLRQPNLQGELGRAMTAWQASSLDPGALPRRL